MTEIIGTTMQTDDLIYIEDVMYMFCGKASRNVIYAWIREKKLPAMKVGRRFVFSRKRVLAFMAKQLGISYNQNGGDNNLLFSPFNEGGYLFCQDIKNHLTQKH